MKNFIIFILSFFNFSSVFGQVALDGQLIYAINRRSNSEITQCKIETQQHLESVVLQLHHNGNLNLDASIEIPRSKIPLRDGDHFTLNQNTKI